MRRDDLVNFIQRHGDELLAAALTAITLIEVALTEGPEWQRVVFAAGAVAVGAAAARRSRTPLPLLAMFLVISLAAQFAVPMLAHSANSGLFVFLLLAVYSAAAHTSGRDTLVAGGMTIGLWLSSFLQDGTSTTADAVIFYSLLLGSPWVAGRAVRQRRLNDRALEQEKARAVAAIVEERERIARELHDVVAHAISVMVLQARGGRRVLESEPADSREAFATIERTGQQALDEMRRLLGMLRRSDDEVGLAPQPRLEELGKLIERVEAAGLPVQVQVEGERRELPPGVELSAFRVVQEGLTNVLKHAGPARARVILRYGEDDFEVEIEDDGPGAGDGSSPGFGLVGVRERVSIYGGELNAGRRPDGGFTLRVRLPIRSVRA